jgi:hypothetical protein
MYMQIVGNNISCSFDANGDGLLDGSDPIISYVDPSPLPIGQNKYLSRLHIYSFY